MNVTVVKVHTVLWHVWYQRNARSYNLSTTVHSTCNETISLFLSDFHEPLKSKATELVGFIYSPINRFVGRQWERSLKDLRILASPLAPAEASARAGHYESLLKCRFANIWGLQEMCLWQRSKLKQNKWQPLTHFSCWTCTYLLFKVQAHFPPFIPLSKNFNSLLSSFKKKFFCKIIAKIIFPLGKKIKTTLFRIFVFFGWNSFKHQTPQGDTFPIRSWLSVRFTKGNVIL